MIKTISIHTRNFSSDGCLRLSAWWLAIALVATSATRFRLSAAPFGAGEAMLLIWLIVQGGVGLLRGEAAQLFKGRKRHDVWLLLMLLAVLTLSQTSAVLSGRLDLSECHSFMAIVFSLLLAIVLAGIQGRESFSAEFIHTFTIVSMAFASLLWLVVKFLPDGDAFYMGGVRFLALSSNPNQFALLMVTLPAGFSLCMLRYHRWGKIFCVIIGGFAALASLAALSHAMALAWGIISLICVAALAVKGHINASSSKPLIFSAALVCVTWVGWQFLYQVPALNFMAVPPSNNKVPFGQKLIEFQQSPGEANVTSDRLILYLHGLQAWRERPLLGHGVQMVSGIEASYQGKESHNSLIDWADFTGLVGLVPLVCWFILLLQRTWKEKNTIGLMALVSLAVFAQFHLIVRQPVFWLLALAFTSLPVNGGPHDRLTASFEDRVQ